MLKLNEAKEELRSFACPKCERSGENCKCAHVFFRSSKPSISPSDQKQLSEPVQDCRATMKCIQFQAQKICRGGRNCPFSHAVTKEMNTTWKEQASLPRELDWRSKVDCISFSALRTCVDGEKCPYYHTDNDDDDSAEQFDHFSHVISGAIVTFKENGTVSQVLCPSEKSRLQFLHGPIGPYATPELMSRDCLRRRGVTIEPELCTSFNNFSKTTAICFQFSSEDECRKRSKNPDFADVPIRPYTPTSIVRGSKVKLQWFDPYDLVWMSFRDESVAREVYTHFNDGTFTILDTVVRAERPRRIDIPASDLPEALLHESFQRLNGLWLVLLHDVPLDASLEDCESTIPKEYAPTTYLEIDEYVLLARIEALQVVVFIREELPRVKNGTFTVVEKGYTDENTMLVEFEDSASAKEAATTLGKASFSFLEIRGAAPVQMFSSTFTFSTALRYFWAKELKALESKFAQKDVSFELKPSNSPGGHFNLTIQGESEQQIIAFSITIQANLGGKIIKDGASNLWNPRFENKSSNKFFRRIESRFGGFLIRNIAKRVVTYHESRENFEKVSEKLKCEFGVQANNYREGITLTEKQFKGANDGGRFIIAQVLGIDLEKHPYSFMSLYPHPITGKKIMFDLPSYDAHLKMVDTLQNIDAYVEMEWNPATQNCTICWGKPEKIVKAKCGHQYCGDCFRQLCMSVVESTKNWDIQCQGDEGECQKVFTLSEIYDIFTTPAYSEETPSFAGFKEYSDLLEALFASFIRRNTSKYRYCPSPSCGDICWLEEGSCSYTCKRCGESACTRCGAQHGDHVTCDEWKDLATEALKQKLGYKDCPKCNVSINKEGGCNLVHCPGCKIRICWKCLMCFDTNKKCYDHLSKEHGGFFDRVPAEQLHELVDNLNIADNDNGADNAN